MPGTSLVRFSGGCRQPEKATPPTRAFLRFNLRYRSITPIKPSARPPIGYKRGDNRRFTRQTGLAKRLASAGPDYR